MDPIVVFAHDGLVDEIYRLSDLNGDGDMHDPGEATLFYDNTPGDVLGIMDSRAMLAVDEWTLLAADTFLPRNVLLLRDLDRDGSALGEGEAIVYFDGASTPGGAIGRPSSLIEVSAGVYYLSTGGTTGCLWRLEDLNSDGDANDPGEAVVVHQFAPEDSGDDIAGLALGPGDLLYFLDVFDNPAVGPSVDVVDLSTGAESEFAVTGPVSDFILPIIITINLGYHEPTNDLIAIGAAFRPRRAFLVALRDGDASSTIEEGEARVFWSTSDNADGISIAFFRYFVMGTDGSIVATDGDRKIYRIADLNGDGDANDLGETTLLYDASIGVANGLFAGEFLIRVTSVPIVSSCSADLSGDGVLNSTDANLFLSAFMADDAAADFSGDGLFNNTDINLFVSAFLAGCG